MRGRYGTIAWVIVAVAVVGFAAGAYRAGMIPSSWWRKEAPRCLFSTAVLEVEPGGLLRPDGELFIGGGWRLSARDGVVSVVTQGWNPKPGTDELTIRLRYDPSHPEGEYRTKELGGAGWARVSAQGWGGCEPSLAGSYTITRFTDPKPPTAIFGAELRLRCPATGQEVTGCVQVVGRVEGEAPEAQPAQALAAAGTQPEAAPGAEPADAASPSGPSGGDGLTQASDETAVQEGAAAGGEGPEEAEGGAPKDSGQAPLGKLPSCPPWEARLGPSARTERPAGGGVELVGGYRTGWDRFRTRLPSALDAQALARRHFTRFGLTAPIPADVRPGLASMQRDRDGWEGGPAEPPPSVPFDVPEGDIPGHFYLFTSREVSEVKAEGAEGALLLSVDANGCERGDRTAIASVKVPGREGILFWSPEPVPMGKIQPLTPGTEIVVRDERLVLAAGGENLSGPAERARISGAYLVKLGGRTRLLVDYGAWLENQEPCFCSELVVYDVGRALTPVGRLNNDCQDSIETLGMCAAD